MGGGDQASPSASDLHHFLFRSQGGSSFDLQVLPWKILGGIRWKFRKSRNWGFEWSIWPVPKATISSLFRNHEASWWFSGRNRDKHSTPVVKRRYLWMDKETPFWLLALNTFDNMSWLPVSACSRVTAIGVCHLVCGSNHSFFYFKQAFFPMKTMLYRKDLQIKEKHIPKEAAAVDLFGYLRMSCC